MRKIVVVGASLAGVTAADRLRELGYEGALELIGEEAAVPYDRPPLSKDFLSEELPERIALRKREHFQATNLTLRLGARATGLNLAAQELSLEGGETVSYDGLIIATGARPRLPDFPLPERGVCVLRTVQDAVALRRALQARPRLVIVGAGFIGLEVATVARREAIDVTVIEPQPYPMFRAIGPETGARVRRMLEDLGVRTHFGLSVSQLIGTDSVRSVLLSDGSEIPADLVLLSIGSVPNSEWLAGSGLTRETGIACDGFCQAAPGVFAIGDVASRFDPTLGRHVRAEHWTSAIEHAAAAAHNLLRPQEEWQGPSGVAYVWSDQLGGRLQIAGLKPTLGVEHVIEDMDKRRFAACYQAEGRIRAMATFDWPALLVRGRTLIAQNADWETALGILRHQAELRRQSA